MIGAPEHIVTHSLYAQTFIDIVFKFLFKEIATRAIVSYYSPTYLYLPY